MGEENKILIEISGDPTKLTGAVNIAANSLDQKLTPAVDKGTGAAMRNWRETNRMSGSMQSAAMQLGGMHGAAAMAFNMMDNFGDSLERNAIRGRSAKEVWAGMSAELGMMVSAGAIAAVAYGLNAMNKQMEETIKLFDEAEKIWLGIEIDNYKFKLAELKKQYDKNAISSEEYRIKVNALNEELIRTQAAEKINKLTEAAKRLDDQIHNSEFNPLNVALQAWDAVTGTFTMKLTGYYADIQAANAKLQNDLKLSSMGTESEITTHIEGERTKRENAMVKEMEKEMVYVDLRAKKYTLDQAWQISSLTKLDKFKGAMTQADWKRQNEIAEREKLIEFNKQQFKAAMVSQGAGIVMGVLKQHTAAYKALAIIQATADTYAAANAALKTGNAIFPGYGVVAAAIAVAAGLANVAKITGLSDDGGGGGGGVSMPTMPEPPKPGTTGDGYGGGDYGGGYSSGGSLSGAQSITVYQTNSLVIQGNVIAEDFTRKVFDTILAGNRAAGATVQGGL